MELKPCPFCGGEAQLTLFLGNPCIACKECLGAVVPFPGVSKEIVIRAWNRRTSGVKHGGWISVKERLPEEDGEYLIGWANSDEMYLSCFTRDCFGMSFGLRDEEQEHRPAWYYIDDEWGEVEWDNVEYWMEKPAPPETKGEENE